VKFFRTCKQNEGITLNNIEALCIAMVMKTVVHRRDGDKRKNEK
jgi:hypothetical protein